MITKQTIYPMGETGKTAFKTLADVYKWATHEDYNIIAYTDSNLVISAPVKNSEYKAEINRYVDTDQLDFRGLN